ncbi:MULTISPECIES: phosphoribosyltransferase-like protein [Bacillus cereus group]|uniref:phosphoribosyltransferase-like protein n=1 Tax=Bacillus cereus group TaxID=86661 RepID=UPI0008FDE81E|nr:MULTISPECIES: hypothetical protein [Bacillus cereus group]MDG1620883.1 hypothetical protein [Bacillus mobilis]MDX5838458.1 hypothetical protein [Bacillus cereus group sp. BfR-BA-01700]OJE47491.1 hypothetical protein BAQ44_26140 [Bacillus mobilis]HDR7241621.1 hypothetical protein [Bacillus mobilis]
MTEQRQLTEIQRIAASCIDRWGEDVKTRNFSSKLGKFVSQLDSNKTLGQVFLNLVRHYNYYSRERLEQIIVDFYNIIVNELKLDEEFTIYSRIEDDSKIDSSNFFLEEFKILNNISNHFSYDIEKLGIRNFENIHNVIFIDDIIGSGKTVESFFEKNKRKLLKVNCFIFCVEMLEEGKSHLEDFFKKNNFNCEIICHNLHRKAFSENHIFCEDCKENETLLRDFERGLWGKKSKNILGFENSQAILSFFRNTPNNTLSSFWFENEQWKGLFPRDDRKPAFKKSRKNSVKYNMKKMENLVDD